MYIGTGQTVCMVVDGGGQVVCKTILVFCLAPKPGLCPWTWTETKLNNYTLKFYSKILPTKYSFPIVWHMIRAEKLFVLASKIEPKNGLA